MQVLDDPRLPLGLPGSQVDDREDHYVSRPDSRQERFPPTLPMGVDLECKKSCLHHLIPEPSSFSGEVQSIRNNPDSAPPLLQVPRERHRARSPSPDAVSLPSSDDFGEFRRPLYWHDASADDDLRSRAAAEAARSKGFKRFLIVSWLRNKGVALVLLSQAFGCLMSVTTRLLEMGGEDEERLDPFQVTRTSHTIGPDTGCGRHRDSFASRSLTQVDPVRPHEYHHHVLFTLYVVD